MVEQETPQVVEDETTQPEGQVEPQPTVEELQKQLDEARQEIERKEGVLQQTKRDLKEARQRGASRSEIEALKQHMESQEDFLAGALDDLRTNLAGDYEEPKPSRKSYKQELEERRQKSKPEEPRPDPDAQKFLNYCEAMDLHLDYDDLDACDPAVKEALSEGRNFKEGLKHLKDKMKNNNVDMDKLLDEKLNARLQQEREKWAKDLGLTSEGAGAPSGSESGFEKLEQDYADGKISWTEYKKARQEKGIL